MHRAVSVLVAILVYLSGLSSAMAAPVDYTLDKTASDVGFIWFLGKDEVKGSMQVAEARMSLDFVNVANSKVDVSVDAAGARAGAAFADAAMKGPSVLWVDAHPLIRFVSRRVRPDGSGALIDGDLTVRGVTRPVTFAAKLFRPADRAAGDKSRLTIRLTGSVSRSAFGADGWSGIVGDEVKLSISAAIEQAK